MQVHRDISSLPEFSNAVISIGSFDGIHKGHQKIITRMKSRAEEIKGETVIITFNPHPREVIYPKDKSLVLLNNLNEKIFLLKKFGVDHLVIIPFSIEFSQQSAKEYIEKFIYSMFKPACVVIGYDHRFGINRQGDIRDMNQGAEKYGFEVITIEKEDIDQITISSTKTRNAIGLGNFELVNKLLGYHYLIHGKVIHGLKIGHSLGFPTANLKILSKNKLLPPEGIYAVFAIVNGIKKKGMLYIGKRPSINPHGERSIEINIFDFDEEIYGESVFIQIVKYLRSDAKFDSLDDLRKALAADRKNSLLVLEPYSIDSKSN